MEDVKQEAQGAQRSAAAKPDPLASIPNLGPKSAAMLTAAGIHTLVQLRALGSVAAYVQVQQHAVQAGGLKPSLNLLWALEGALTGAPWQQVAREHRVSLLWALEAVSGQGLKIMGAPGASGTKLGGDLSR